MSKNKNPLKDLDLFLKQQASSFVNPTPLSEKIKEEADTLVTPEQPSANQEDIVEAIDKLMEQDPSSFYDILIHAAEKHPTPERVVLINTMLYLKNTNNWQEAIKAYWQKSKLKPS
jgi:hypothetical protein